MSIPRTNGAVTSHARTFGFPSDTWSAVAPTPLAPGIAWHGKIRYLREELIHSLGIGHHRGQHAQTVVYVILVGLNLTGGEPGHMVRETSGLAVVLGHGVPSPKPSRTAPSPPTIFVSFAVLLRNPGITPSALPKPHPRFPTIRRYD